MNQTITLNTTTVKRFAGQLEQFEEMKLSLLRLLPESAFKRGGKLWWEKVEMMADDDITHDRVHTAETVDSLIHDLSA